VKTSGDAKKLVGDKSRWVKEIEEALLDGRADLAVHSAKDVPGELPTGLSIVGVPPRADPRDSLCVKKTAPSRFFHDLPEGAVVGTSALRRQAQVLALRPDLVVREIRGNVDTRLRKLSEGEYGALVLAAAGLERLDRAGEGTPIDADVMTPAPGQGCLALEARSDDEETRELAASITDPAALVALTAERAVVQALEATCNTPIGAFAEVLPEGDGLRLSAFAGLPDGSEWVRDQLEGDIGNPSSLGRSVGDRMTRAGARSLLDAAEMAV
jgi:hydroxymethylbilane synthase